MLKDLRKVYSAKASEELVYALENPSEYIEECIDIIKELVEERSDESEAMIELSKPIFRDKVKAELSTFSISKPEFNWPDSHFLEEDQKKIIIKEELELFLENKEASVVDSFQYVLAAFL